MPKAENITEHQFCEGCGGQMIEKALVVEGAWFNKKTGSRTEIQRKVWVCKTLWTRHVVRYKGQKFGHDMKMFGPKVPVVTDVDLDRPR